MPDTPLTEVARRAFTDKDFFERLLDDADAALAEARLDLSPDDRARLDAALSGEAVTISFDFKSWVAAIHYLPGIGLPGPRWPGQEWAEMLFRSFQPAPRSAGARTTSRKSAAKRAGARKKGSTAKRSAGARKRGSAAKGRSSSRRKK